MPINPVNMIAAQQLTAAAVIYYKAPAGTVTQIRKLTLTNTTSGAVTVTIYLVATGGTAGDPNTIVKTRSVAAFSTYEAFELEGHLLASLSTIQVLAGLTASVTIYGSGLELS